MKIKSVQLMESITLALENEISYSEWLRLAPNHFAVLNGGKRYSVKDVEKNYSELDAETLDSLRDWELESGKSVAKSPIAAARMRGSETIRTKKFASQKAILIHRSAGVLPGKKDRRR